jgi:hypothetical protein
LTLIIIYTRSFKQAEQGSYEGLFIREIDLEFILHRPLQISWTDRLFKHRHVNLNNDLKTVDILITNKPSFLKWLTPWGAAYLNTVNDRIPDLPVFEWSFSGRFLGPVLEWTPSCFSHSKTEL